MLQVAENFKIRFLPLIVRRVGMRPSKCNSICGTSKCAKRSLAGNCPTNCLQTAKCGGWAEKISNPTTYANFAERVSEIKRKK